MEKKIAYELDFGWARYPVARLDEVSIEPRGFSNRGQDHFSLKKGFIVNPRAESSNFNVGSSVPDLRACRA